MTRKTSLSKPRSAKPAQERAVRAVRTPFGTRVMHHLTCARCGKEDYVPFAPKDNAGKTWCRECAERELNIVEDHMFKKNERVVSCRECGQKTIKILKAPQFENPLDLKIAGLSDLCRSCELNMQAEARKIAYKSIGVHPLVVKKKSRNQ